MKKILAHKTSKEPVYIAKSNDGWFHVVYKNESLGSYASPTMAIDDASSGYTFVPFDGTDLGSLGLSDNAKDWILLLASDL
jgi:hypothetical protein